MLGDLRAEIARVRSPQPIALPQSFSLSKPTAKSPVPSTVAPLGGRAPTSRSPLADIHAMPPLPPPPVAGRATAGAPAVRVPSPKLAVECATVGDDRAGRCGGLIATNERLVIRATEAFKGPVSLRFSRTGSSVSAEVPFAMNGLRAGQTARFKIPREICAGRVRAKFEIEPLTAGRNGSQAGDRLGPFETRCGS